MSESEYYSGEVKRVKLSENRLIIPTNSTVGAQVQLEGPKINEREESYDNSAGIFAVRDARTTYDID